jgi:hypothetical protein
MDIQMESLLEDMHVNWSIILSSIEKEQNQIKEAFDNPQNLLESVLKNSDHVNEDKVVKHQQRKEVTVSGGTSTELIKKGVEARKRMTGFDMI